MKKFLLFIFTGLLSSQGLIFSQQKVWSLEDCIKYAIDNNIQIKQQDIQTKYQENTLDLAKLKLLPSINGSATHNYSFGRALDQTTYQYTDQQKVQSNNFYIGGSLNLFSGLQNYNTIKKNEYELLAGEQDLQNIKDNIALSVALDYLQILLNKELVVATENQLQITKQQIEKSRKLVDAGSVAKGNLLQIEAQAAQEELQFINIKNQLDISYLNISQLLELETPEGFEIITPGISIDTNGVISGNIDEIFAAAQGTRPEVKSSELKLTASEYDMKIALGGRSPRLTMNHSFSTGYSDIRKKLLGLDPVTTEAVYGKYSFADQVNDNISYGIGFSLNIPILNGWQVTKNIANSKLGVESNRYTLEGVKKQLYKSIQQAYTDAIAALKKYNASIKAVSSTEESFRYTEQKFNVGMVTPVDYNAGKTQLLKVQSDMSQAKYEFIFKTKVLDFYKGIPLNLNK
ncbi:MAG: TolC family protein [Bacteroidia bacterium]|nr:TolC family protein [Bacteroidia bacterium]